MDCIPSKSIRPQVIVQHNDVINVFRIRQHRSCDDTWYQLQFLRSLFQKSSTILQIKIFCVFAKRSSFLVQLSQNICRWIQVELFAFCSPSSEFPSLCRSSRMSVKSLPPSCRPFGQTWSPSWNRLWIKSSKPFLFFYIHK